MIAQRYPTVLFVGALASSFASAGEVKITPKDGRGADAYVSENEPDKSFWAEETNKLLQTGQGNVGLVRFDLSQVNFPVKDAQLEMYYLHSRGRYGNQIKVYGLIPRSETNTSRQGDLWNHETLSYSSAPGLKAANTETSLPEIDKSKLKLLGTFGAHNGRLATLRNGTFSSFIEQCGKQTVTLVFVGTGNSASAASSRATGNGQIPPTLVLFDLKRQITIQDHINSIERIAQNANTNNWGHPLWDVYSCFVSGKRITYANERLADFLTTWKHCRRELNLGGVPRTVFVLYLKPSLNKLLTEANRKAIADKAYDQVFYRSQISPSASEPINASRSPWEITGSENHDIIQKSNAYLGVQILCESKCYGPDTKLGDGNPAKEHLAAWEKYLPKYAIFRAKEGMDCEIGEVTSYGKATVGSWYDIYHFATTKKIKELYNNLLTLYFARVAVEFEPKTGLRGAWVHTRGYRITGFQQPGYWARYILGAYGWHDTMPPNCQRASAELLTNSYRPPEILKAIARGRADKSFLSTSRHFGMTKNDSWKPFEGIGGIYFMHTDESGNSNLLTTAYYTPFYTLSALTWDPAKQYIELVNQSKIMGITFSADLYDRIMILGSISGFEKKAMVTSKLTNGICLEDTLVVARDVNAKSAFEVTKMATYKHIEETGKDGMRMFISKGLLEDNLESNQNGWSFTRNEDSFVGFRIAGDTGYTAEHNPQNTGLRIQLNDIWAPIAVQTAPAKEFGNDFKTFKKAISSLPFEYKDKVMNFTTRHGEKVEYFSQSNKIPMVNGKVFEINPPTTYNSPYLKMKHGEEEAVISYPGYKELVLKFNN